MDTFLAIESNVENNNRFIKLWNKYGVMIKRVDSIHEAIGILKNEQHFLFITINEDSFPNFINQLPIIRDITYIPILVATSNYTLEKEIQARSHGADGYGAFAEIPEMNIQTILGILESLNRANKESARPLPEVQVLGDIILSPSRRIAYVKDHEISLSRKEFDILHFLISRSGYVISHEQILQKVWGREYDGEFDIQLLWRTVDRLRSKISKLSKKEYIIIERGVGYKITLPQI